MSLEATEDRSNSRLEIALASVRLWSVAKNEECNRPCCFPSRLDCPYKAYAKPDQLRVLSKSLLLRPVHAELLAPFARYAIQH
jgi:hypothetical protein